MAKPSVKASVDITPDLASIAAKFRKSPKRHIASGMAQLSKKVHRNIQGEAPVKTGDLRQAIVERKVGDLEYHITVDSRARGSRYEPFVRLGVPASRINPIFPRVKRALYWPGARHPVKAVYRHPGIKPNPYFDRGIDKSQGDISRAESELGIKIETELIE